MRTDELELEPLAGVEVAQTHSLADVDAAVPRLRLDDSCRPEPLLESCDAALEQRLLLARVQVVGALARVRLRGGAPQPLRDPEPTDRPQALELLAQACQPVSRDDRLVHSVLLCDDDLGSVAAVRTSRDPVKTPSSR